MKLSVILFFITSYCALLQAQIQVDSFDLSSYARPDLERKIKIIEPVGEFSNNVFTHQEFDNQKSVGLNLRNNYRDSRFINSETEQTFITNSAFFRFGMSRSVESTDTSKIRNHSFSTSYSLNRNLSRKKFREAQRFREVRYGFNHGYGYSFNTSDDTPKEENRKEHSLNASIQLGLFWGKGRIELVNDAWHAMSILDFLQQDGLLQRTINRDDIKLFADRIAEIKNFRNTDSRLESIAEFEALSEYLVASNIVNSNDYRFFALVLDAWRFESFLNRFSGKELKFGILPSVQIYNTQSERFNDFDDLETSLAFAVEYNYYQPIGRYWQYDRNFSLRIGASVLKDITGAPLLQDRTDERAFTDFSAQWRLSYLPSQRTNYTISFRMGYNVIYTPDDEIFSSRDGLFGVLAGTYDYYITPQIAWRLEGNLNLRSRHINTNSFSYRSNVRFNISYRLL